MVFFKRLKLNCVFEIIYSIGMNKNKAVIEK